MRRVAYLTDVEGRWEKLAEFCAGTSLVELTADGALRVADDTVFVFGGDAIDRGPDGRRIMALLLAAKQAQPDRVVLIAGNRDINKMRLSRELAGAPPAKAPPEIVAEGRAPLLRFIFERTMGAKDAFEHRRTELAREGRGASDDDVAESFLEDVAPSGAITRYLAACQLGHREGTTLFVHGAVTGESLGRVPGSSEKASSVDAWVDRLNAFYSTSVEAFVARAHDASGAPKWQALVDYQAPVRGTKLNQASVVYGRPTNDANELVLPHAEVVDELVASDVWRVVVGHTPSGDCPAVLRDARGFELVLADNSYGRIEGGPRVLIDERVLSIEGTTELDSGERRAVALTLEPRSAGPLGLRDRATGRLVKSRLASGDYLTFRALPGYGVEQRVASADDLAGLELEPPH